jgi:hypothetical protein
MEISRQRSGGGSVAAWLGGFAAGALVMYVFDPDRGRRRRALARDKAIHAARVASDTIGARSRDLSNRARGVVAETRSALEHASDSRPSSDAARSGPPENGSH